jgi:hypothetical protein
MPVDVIVFTSYVAAIDRLCMALAANIPLPCRVITVSGFYIKAYSMCGGGFFDFFFFPFDAAFFFDAPKLPLYVVRPLGHGTLARTNSPR